MSNHDLVPHVYRIRLPGILRWVVDEIFVAALVSAFSLFALDSLIAGFVDSQLDIEFVYWVTIGTGVLSAAQHWNDRDDTTQFPMRRRGGLVIAIYSGIIVAVVTFFSIAPLGSLRPLISLLTGILVLASVTLVFEHSRHD